MTTGDAGGTAFTAGEELRVFWERMTRVRMEYIADPGPAATAVRVAGLVYADLLIEIEAIAVVRRPGTSKA